MFLGSKKKTVRFAIIFGGIVLLGSVLLGIGCSRGTDRHRTITWQHPLPHGYNINGIWGSSLNNIFIVGNYGSIARYDGSSWKMMETGTTENFWSVWGTGTDNVYASTDYAIYHYNGSNWRKCYQYSGGDDNPHFNPIWGSSASDIFVGGAGVLMHYNGTVWTTMEIGTDLYITGIWGTASNNVYAICNDFGLVFHYDGHAWTKVNESIHPLWLGAIWGSSANDIYVGGGYPFIYGGGPKAFHFNGTSWSEIAYDFNNQGVQKIWGTAANDVYVLDSGADIHHFDGTNWTRKNIGLDFVPSSVWFYNAENQYFVGENGIIGKYDGSSLTVNVEAKDRGQLFTIYFLAPDNIYTGGGENILHYNGTSWESIYLGFGDCTTALWGTSPTDLYAVGGNITPDDLINGFIAHYDGSTWTQVYYDDQMGFSAIWGSSANDIFVASSTGRMVHYNGTTWETTNLPWSGIYRLWGSAGNDVYAGCDFGVIIHYDGNNWRVAYDLEGEEGVGGLTGFSSREVYAGIGNKLVRYDGINWKVVATTGSAASIVRLWGMSGKDLYVLSANGQLHHYDGSRLIPLPRLWEEDLGISGMGGLSSDDIYFVGLGGAILRYL